MTTLLDPLNLILLAVAALVLWKLKSVLGTRTGLEKRPPEIIPNRLERPESRVRPAEPAPTPESTANEPIWKEYADEGTDLAKGLEAIAKASQNFNPASFLAGARVAYEMILDAFAKGDKAGLKPLLAKDMQESFFAAVDQRLRNEQSMVMQFVGVKSAKIDAARLEGRKALISIRFVAEMISATLDKAGVAIDGDAKQVREVTDVWTFERDVNSRDPNWKLAETSDVNT